MMSYNVDENVKHRSNVFDVSFWSEKQAVGKYFQSQFNAHEHNETVFCNLKSRYFHHSKFRRLEHHRDTGQGCCTYHEPVKISHKSKKVASKINHFIITYEILILRN